MELIDPTKLLRHGCLHTRRLVLLSLRAGSSLRSFRSCCIRSRLKAHTWYIRDLCGVGIGVYTCSIRRRHCRRKYIRALYGVDIGGESIYVLLYDVDIGGAS